MAVRILWNQLTVRNKLLTVISLWNKLHFRRQPSIVPNLNKISLEVALVSLVLKLFLICIKVELPHQKHMTVRSANFNLTPYLDLFRYIQLSHREDYCNEEFYRVYYIYRKPKEDKK